MLHIVREGRSLNIPDSKDPVTDTAEDIDKEYVDKTAYSLCFMQAFLIALWCSGKASDSRSRGTGFDPH